MSWSCIQKASTDKETAQMKGWYDSLSEEEKAKYIVRRALGFDFDPLQLVFDVGNRESKFSNGVMHNGALIGILLGFGRDNAWFFEWGMRYEEEQNKIGSFLKSLPVKTYET